MGVKGYLAKRVSLSIGVIIGTLSLTFFIARIIPSNPAALWCGSHPTKEQIARARERLGLDEPLYIQYISYIKGFFTGDWGYSITRRSPVFPIVFSHLTATLELLVVGFGIAVLFGVPLGVLAAVKEGTWFDNLTRVISIAGYSMPVFWLGLTLQLVFYGQLHVLPLTGRLSSEVILNHPLHEITGFYLVDSLITGNWPALVSALQHIILPAICVAAYPLGLTVRQVRSEMIEVLQKNYIKAARANGVPERTIKFKYALKNSLAPALNVLALSFAYSLTGIFLIEVIFNWGGIGSLAAHAIRTLDYPVILGIVFFVVLFYILLNLAVDLLQTVIDPRVKY